MINGVYPSKYKLGPRVGGPREGIKEGTANEARWFGSSGVKRNGGLRETGRSCAKESELNSRKGKKGEQFKEGRGQGDPRALGGKDGAEKRGGK